MARTITIVDEEKAVELVLVMDPGGQELPPRITSLTISASEGVQSHHLLLLAEFGLTLPGPDPVRRPAPALIEQRRPITSLQAPAGRATRPTSRAAKAGPVKPVRAPNRPRPADFPEVATRLGYKPGDLAAHYVAPKTVIYTWLNNARKTGEIPKVGDLRADRDTQLKEVHTS